MHQALVAKRMSTVLFSNVVFVVQCVPDKLTPLNIIIATAGELQRPEFSHVCGACPCADADDFSSV